MKAAWPADGGECSLVSRARCPTFGAESEGETRAPARGSSLLKEHGRASRTLKGCRWRGEGFGAWGQRQALFKGNVGCSRGLSIWGRPTCTSGPAPGGSLQTPSLRPLPRGAERPGASHPTHEGHQGPAPCARPPGLQVCRSVAGVWAELAVATCPAGRRKESPSVRPSVCLSVRRPRGWP